MSQFYHGVVFIPVVLSLLPGSAASHHAEVPKNFDNAEVNTQLILVCVDGSFVGHSMCLRPLSKRIEAMCDAVSADVCAAINVQSLRNCGQ